MELRQLELFLAVLDEDSSVTRAAARMNLSPGAVSLQLHSLAAELRADLFTRAGKRLVPAPAAHRLAEHARAVLAGVRAIEHEFAAGPMEDQRPFRFATGATALIHHLGPALRQLRKRFPRAAIDITVAATEEMVTGVLNRRFDLALISLPFSEDGLDLIPLFEEELLVLKPSAQRVNGWHIGAIRPDELADAPFVLYPKRSNMRSIIENLFREIGIAPRIAMEADDTEALKKLVETGFGYSILPEYALRGGPRFFQMFRVQGKKLARTQALAMARSERRRALTGAVARFLRASLSGQR